MTDDIDALDIGDGDGSLIERWRMLAQGVAPILPGNWRLRGRGWNTVLVREPFEWTVPWIGFERSSFSESGWFQAAVEPLVGPGFSWSRSSGLRMDEIPNGPGYVDLRDGGSAEELRKFVLGPALAEIERWTPELLAQAAERSLPVRSGGGGRRITGSWLPVGASSSGPTRLRAPCSESSTTTGRPREKELQFYQSLLDHSESGGRPGALAFLDRDRVRKVKAAGLARA